MQKLLCLFFNICAVSLMAQTAYVNPSASGSGDGSSWENAYTSLENGLADLNADQLWIAAGTYIPSETDSGYFLLNRNMDLYGGFAGTETSIENRDFMNNVTILSGDINEDDIPGDFSQNRTDNTLHVLFVRDADKSRSITIDGITVQGGNTLNDGDLGFEFRAGGGILSDNSLQVRNCNFNNNFARSGAGLLINDTVRLTANEISNCTFENNLGSAQGVAFVLVDSVMIANTTFKDNNSVRGAFYPLNSRSVRIDNSTFDNNVNINGTGGGIFAIGNQYFEITNSTFKNNFATFQGGGIYNSQDDFQTEPSSFKIDNCNFEANMCSDTAGSSSAIRMWQNKTIEITNSTFLNNFARSGGTVSSNQSALVGTEINGNTLIENCLFEANSLIDTSSGFGGALNLWQNKNVRILKSQFKLNRSFSAACIYADARNIDSLNFKTSFLVADCLFEQNTATAFSGVATFWQGIGIKLERDTFQRNTGSSAGAVNYNGSSTFPTSDPDNFQMTDCTFSNNRASSFGGGAMYNSSGSITMTNVEFLNNSGDNGSHFFNTGTNKRVIINNSSFSGGVANFGGAMTNYNVGTYTTLNNCLFRENNAQNNGGAINSGFKARLEVINCNFETNSASFGGAINAFNDTSYVLIENSTFTENSASNNGGSVNGAGGPNLNILNSTFTANFADFGGGINYGASGVDTSNLVISNVTMTENGAGNQGGAVNIFNGNTQITNSLIFFNEVQGNGTGGAISYNAFDSVRTELEITNSTIGANFGNLAAGIGVFTDSFPETEGLITLQNNAFRNEGTNYAVEGGFPTVVSMGGNISSDGTMSEFLTATQDQNDLNPGFLSYDDLMFELAAGSPCIDNGVESGAPDKDILGLGRNGTIDIGAFEFEGIVLSNPTIIDNAYLSIRPNPVVAYLNLELDNDWKGNINVFITNVNGQLLHHQQFDKLSEKQLFSLPVNQLSSGAYIVFIENNNQRISKMFIKE